MEIEDVWNEIGYPIFTATQQLPPISFILQLRSERREANLFDFKDEIAPLLIFLNLLGQLKDDKLGGGKTIAILFRFYRIKVCSEAGEHRADELVENFIVDLCKLILVARIIDKEAITLNEVLNIVLRKQTSVDQVVELGLQTLGSQSYASAFQKCLGGLPSLEEMACWEEEEDEENEGEKRPRKPASSSIFARPCRPFMRYGRPAKKAMRPARSAKWSTLALLPSKSSTHCTP